MRAKLLSMLTIFAIGSLDAIAQTTLILQPDPVKGKDAEIAYILPDNNWGTSQKMSPYAWTQDGILNIVRGFIEFDLSSIPANATITDAKLSLFYNPHYPALTEHNGSNALWIERVTSAWGENTITWNTQPSTTTTNRLNIPASTFNKQHYPDIDVKLLIQDMLSSTNYGFMFRLQNETPYNNVMLASSDNTDEAIRPKLVITYTVPSDNCITLQPDSIKGKDAEISFIVPDNNYGSSQKMSPYAWTQNGDLNITRGLIAFDLSNIPANAVITDAKLSLYHNPNYPALTEHNGNNALWIRRIITAWEENTVTWNTQPTTTSTNQISVPASTSPTQNYPNINIMVLIQDMLTNPANGHGLMIQLQNETPYADVMLASSDNTDASLRPKLEICYSVASGIIETTSAKPLDKVSIYPNPFSYSSTIQLQSVMKNGELTIFNVQGQAVKTIKNISGQTIEFTREELASGIYFIRLTENNQLIASDKVIIE